jgi:uncharacterized membrane protein YfcA
VADLFLAVPLGVLGGVLTTVAGMGGGMILLLVLSVAWGPLPALAATAPALLVGNFHRAFTYRRSIDRDVVIPFALGAVPGSLAGGFAAVALPTWALDAILLATTLLALAKSTGLVAFRPRAAHILPAGVGIGAVAATSGGAGLLVSPLMMSTGLTGEPYVATVAAAAVAMHVGRSIAYGVSGLEGPGTLWRAAVIAAALLVGNAFGGRVRAKLTERAGRAIEAGVLVLGVALAILGVAR